MFKRSKKKAKAPSTSDALEKLRSTEEMLLKKQEFLESKMQKETETAKKNAKTNKRVALNALKRKKNLEKQLNSIDGTLTTVEMQREALESASSQTAVLSTMSTAAKALKAAHNQMSVDEVHDTMEDIAEQQDIAREISDAFSSSASFQYDEDDLEAELAALGDDMDNLGMGDLDNEEMNLDLPSVPTSNPTRSRSPRKTKEDENLEALLAWSS